MKCLDVVKKSMREVGAGEYEILTKYMENLLWRHLKVEAERIYRHPGSFCLRRQWFCAAEFINLS